MALYRISGIWKDSNSVITHYAFHKVESDGTTRAMKKTKNEAITLLENGNNATTWMWNYRIAAWSIGEDVHVVDGANGKFLRSNHDGKVSDNLGHLIDFDWIG